MPQTMQPALHPFASGRLSSGMQRFAQGPEMLAGVIEVQQLMRLAPTIPHDVPDPRSAVSHRQHVAGTSQTAAHRFPMQSPSQLQAFALPTDHHFFQQLSPCRPRRLFVPVKDAQLRFMPFHAAVASFFVCPTPARESALETHPPSAPPAASAHARDIFPPGLFPVAPAFGLPPWPPAVAPKPGSSNPPPDNPPWPTAWPPPHTSRSRWQNTPAGLPAPD